MSDLNDEAADVAEALRKIEGLPEPSDEPEQQEPVAETLDQEPQAEAQEEAVPSDPIVHEYLQKFGGNMDEAVRSAAHRESLYGRQASELGDVRKQLAELSERVPQEPQKPEPPPYDEERFDDYVLENPQEAATWALQTYGHGSRPYERAMSAWAEDHPLAASRFDTGYLLWQQQQQSAQEYEQRLQPLQEQQQVQQLAQSYHKVRQRHADAVQYEAKMQEIATANPALVQSFASDPEALIEFLYAKARLDDGTPPSPSPPSRDAVAEKMAATVATASSTPPADGDKPRDPLYLLAEKGMQSLSPVE